MKPADKGSFFICEHNGKSWNVAVPAAGLHNVRNALAALAVASALEVPPEDAVRAIASYKPPKMRQEILDLNGIKVIDDTYNASPDSVKAGLDILAGMQIKGRRIAVLGDMFELGAYAAISHFEVGRHAQEKGIDLLITVGEMGIETGKGFGEKKHFHFANNAEAADFLMENLNSGDAVLVKGSRGMKMDEIVEKLKEDKLN